MDWNLVEGKCIQTFEGHKDLVWELALNENRQLIYSGSSDNTIKKWDLETRQCLHTIDYRLCAGANITNVKGLTPAQIDSLLALGAIDNNRK
jgi:WD40 repeat protein